jgi:hypothetical protein
MLILRKARRDNLRWDIQQSPLNGQNDSFSHEKRGKICLNFWGIWGDPPGRPYEDMFD